MSQEPKTQPAPETADEQELDADQLEQASGGIGLLLPAVQKVRDAAASSSDTVPTEQVSFNYTKI